VNPCQTCSSFTSCISCVSNYYLSVSASLCLTICPNTTVAGYNASSTRNECLLCQSPCFTCSVAINSCTSCLSINNQTYFLLNSSCVVATACPNGTYASNLTYKCTSCTSPCSSCLSSTNCTDCAQDYYLFESQCMQYCPNGSYAVNASGIIECLNCSTSCSTCSSSASNCTTCSNSTYLLNNSCVNSTGCSNGTFANSAVNMCSSCNSSCSSCSNSSNCSSCASGFYLNIALAQCVSTCPNGTFEGTNSTTMINQCLNCDSSCRTCSPIALFFTIRPVLTQLHVRIALMRTLQAIYVKFVFPLAHYA